MAGTYCGASCNYVIREPIVVLPVTRRLPNGCDVFPVTWSIASMGVGPSCNYECDKGTYCGASCN
ncbi:unnamed protein product [Rodentolepis nana]|uniref:WAP domain-containing protein n=1 Tax=Rodentolepis nana TaxID=102285 RepID=A0A0R3TIY2_RODNA|nr:unnamed protein product [Rodentolepis nana]